MAEEQKVISEEKKENSEMNEEVKVKKDKKKFIDFSDLKEIKWTNFIGLTAAGIINAFAVTIFLNPVSLIDGGLSGTSILLSRLVSALSLSVWLIILNFPFYLLAQKKQGLTFTLYSLYAICMYSLFSYLFTDVFFASHDFVNQGSPIVGNDIFLGCIFGGLISGIGSGLTIRFGGALDGVEVMGVIFSKKLGMTVGTFVMTYNVILYIVAAVFMSSWEVPLYSIVAYAVGLKAVDFINEGLDKAKAVFIITDKKDEVGALLSDILGRGMTVIDAEGFYYKQKKTILYVVVNRFEITKVKKAIHEIDPDSFVAINEVSDTMGNSFRFSLRGIKK